MKTIFVTLFDGVESKNILRTGIIDRILENDKEVRVVLFTKTKERIDYYKKEFNNPRIFYEVVPIYELKGWDKFFSLRKFLFLQTDTTDLRARLVAEKSGNPLFVYYSYIIHRILARSFFVRLFRYLDYKIVKTNIFDKYFEKYKPDMIFLANLFEDIEVALLQTAKRYKVFSIGLINSWDKVTARCVLRSVPDKLIVFNDNLKKEIKMTNYMKEDDISVSGLPQYDNYCLPQSISRGDFLNKLGLSGNTKIVVYSPIGSTFSDLDWQMIDHIHELNDSRLFGENVKILVRFPPNDFLKDEDIKKRPNMLYQYPGVRFSTIRGADWDMTKTELEELRNTMIHMSLIVCYASSISIDAAFFDKPVININFEVTDSKKLYKSPTLYYKMTHYKKALSTGGIRLVNNTEELIFWVKKYIDNPEIDREGRKKLVGQQCQFTDCRSTERIADFICSFI